MTKSLLPCASTVLGAANRSAPRVTAKLNQDTMSWRVTWSAVDGTCYESTALIASGKWTHRVNSSPGVASDTSTGDANPVDGVWCSTEFRGGALAVRSGQRVMGVRPEFPSASLVLSRRVTGGWIDLAFADDVPDREILAAAVAVKEDDILVVYVVVEGEDAATCRVMGCSTLKEQPVSRTWSTLPAFPGAPGVSAVIAGVHRDVLIAAGGANFPDRPPWESGVRRTYDEIYALIPGETTWGLVGRLPVPRAYAAVVSVSDGVLAFGGENAAGVLQDSLLLSWDGHHVVVKPAPALPEALASPVAVVSGRKVYLVGGYAAGTPRVSTQSFYCLNLDRIDAGWERLPAWPGPSRALTVIAALADAIYVMSGLEMLTGSDGQPKLTYLTDAYRYRPNQGWETLPDLPWSAVAAPSPTPVTAGPDRVFVLGGVDGRQVGKMPRDKRVPEDILYFDVARKQWRLWHEKWPEPVVSSPAFNRGDEWLLVSGETMAGHRTTAVMAWHPTR